MSKHLENTTLAIYRKPW